MEEIYDVYVKKNTTIYWVKAFYANNYKNDRGAYKAALRFAKLCQQKSNDEKIYKVIKRED